MKSILKLITIPVLILMTIHGCKKDEEENACSNTTTVTDVDGNIYHVIQIGSQYWMKENLKTSHFRDGSAIMEGNDSLTWANIYNTGSQTPAWCYVGSNAANDTIYGKLYNWYAVADPRNVCPTGWHVPSDAELTQLTDYLGGEAVAGGKMKAITLWNAHDHPVADNSSCFTALPASARGYNAASGEIGNYGYFWSATESSAVSAWFRKLYYDWSDVLTSTDTKASGFSVRCVRD